MCSSVFALIYFLKGFPCFLPLPCTLWQTQHILQRFCYGFNFWYLDFPLNPTRNPNNQAVFRKFLSLWNQCVRAYYGVFPISAPFNTVEFIPISTLSSIRHPWSTAPCPTLTSFPIWTPFSGSAWITTLSWILVRLPILFYSCLHEARH